LLHTKDFLEDHWCVPWRLHTHSQTARVGMPNIFNSGSQMSRYKISFWSKI